MFNHLQQRKIALAIISGHYTKYSFSWDSTEGHKFSSLLVSVNVKCFCAVDVCVCLANPERGCLT